MRIFSFEDQTKFVAPHPVLVEIMKGFPHCEHAHIFDEYHPRIVMRAELICNVIGCRGAEHFFAQDVELQAERAKYFASATEYWESYFNKEQRQESENELFNLIHAFGDALEEQFHQAKRCHRSWTIATPGLRCYCDELSDS